MRNFCISIINYNELWLSKYQLIDMTADELTETEEIKKKPFQISVYPESRKLDARKFL